MWNKIRDIVGKFGFDAVSGQMFIGNTATKYYLSNFSPAAPAVADVDYYVTTAEMKNTTTYTIAAPSPGDGLCRNVTLTRTVVVDADTPGIVTITGTDYNDEVLTEVIVPGAHSVTVAGVKAFKTVVSAVGTGWVVSSGTDKDTITIGFGNVIGFSKPTHNALIFSVIWNQAILTATSSPAIPAIHYSDRISESTITLPAAGNSTKKLIVIMAKFMGV